MRIRRRRISLLATLAALALGLFSAALAWACSPQAFIDLGARSRHPGDALAVTGTSFLHGPVQIHWNGVGGPVLATGTGPSFTVEITIPDVAPGFYYLHAVARDANGIIQGDAIQALQVLAVRNGFSLSRGVFAVGGSSPRKGTTFRYTLASPAKVKIVIAQRLPGRRRGKRCVAQTPSLRFASRCTRLVVRAVVNRAGREGFNHVAFSGGAASASLMPGSYQATLIVTRGTRGTSKPKTLFFTIVKR